MQKADFNIINIKENMGDTAVSSIQEVEPDQALTVLVTQVLLEVTESLTVWNMEKNERKRSGAKKKV
jgi:hypothetical protein